MKTAMKSSIVAAQSAHKARELAVADMKIVRPTAIPPVITPTAAMLDFSADLFLIFDIIYYTLILS
ncbi:MAG: hypothetical protein B1H06_04060 [Candidatus Cloacimonas sp. 4484_143]|nr:MAG: hypothetical protein B1H06_04060 [Candidatus Cloacimonas sp. 4484_143]